MSDFGRTAYPVAHKQYRCEACYGCIPMGEKHIHFKGVWEGEWQNWRMHNECFKAYEDDGEYEFSPGDMPIPDRIRAAMKEQPK